MDAFHVCGEIDTGIMWINGRECNCVCELGSPPNLSKRKQENYPEKTDLQRQRAQPIHPVFCAKPVHTGMYVCIHTHTHNYVPFWHMATIFPWAMKAKGMAHILHNFKSQTFFCTCIKLENQLTPQHHLPEALLHISGPSGTPGGHYIPWKPVLPSYKITTCLL